MRRSLQASQSSWCFHDPLPPQEPKRAPLAPGRYTVQVEDEGHTCVAETTFVVEP